MLNTLTTVSSTLPWSFRQSTRTIARALDESLYSQRSDDLISRAAPITARKSKSAQHPRGAPPPPSTQRAARRPRSVLTRTFSHSASAPYVRKYPYAWCSTSPYSLSRRYHISDTSIRRVQLEYQHKVRAIGPGHSHEREERADQQRAERRGHLVCERGFLARGGGRVGVHGAVAGRSRGRAEAESRSRAAEREVGGDWAG